MRSHVARNEITIMTRSEEPRSVVACHSRYTNSLSLWQFARRQGPSAKSVWYIARLCAEEIFIDLRHRRCYMCCSFHASCCVSGNQNIASICWKHQAARGISPRAVVMMHISSGLSGRAAALMTRARWQNNDLVGHHHRRPIFIIRRIKPGLPAKRCGRKPSLL